MRVIHGAKSYLLLLLKLLLKLFEGQQMQLAEVFFHSCYVLQFARMTAEELATPQLKELREHLSEGMMEEHMMGEKETVGGEAPPRNDHDSHVEEQWCKLNR